MTRSNRFARRDIRLPPGNYVGNRLYFLTICCQDRKPILCGGGVVTGQLKLLRQLSAEMRFAVHAYCFMPDHLHLLVEGRTPEARLLDFVARFKQLGGYQYKQKHAARLWQRSSYDHVLRRDSEIHDVAWYIWMNPVRKGLAVDPRDYPFSGSFSMNWPTEPGASSWQPPWKKGRPA